MPASPTRRISAGASAMPPACRPGAGSSGTFVQNPEQSFKTARRADSSEDAGSSAGALGFDDMGQLGGHADDEGCRSASGTPADGSAHRVPDRAGGQRFGAAGHKHHGARPAGDRKSVV